MARFDHRGGLRAEIVSGGTIHIGASIVPRGNTLPSDARVRIHDRFGFLHLSRRSGYPRHLESAPISRRADTRLYLLVAVLSAVLYAPATITVIEVMAHEY